MRGQDRRFAYAFVDARIMERLLSLRPPWGFEIQGRWMPGYRDRPQPWEIGGVLETLETLLDKVLRVVSSLYPEAVPPRPDAVR